MCANKELQRGCIAVETENMAGLPILSMEGRISDQALQTDPQITLGDFAIIIKDDSMAGDNICIGDHVVLRPKCCISDGDIALVCVDNHALLRRVFESNEHIALVSANENYTTRYCRKSEEIYFIGKMIKIIKNRSDKEQRRC